MNYEQLVKQEKGLREAMAILQRRKFDTVHESGFAFSVLDHAWVYLMSQGKAVELQLAEYFAEAL